MHEENRGESNRVQLLVQIQNKIFMYHKWSKGFRLYSPSKLIFCTYLRTDGYFPNTQPNYRSNNGLLWHHRGRDQTLEHPSAHSRPCIQNSDNLLGGECKNTSCLSSTINQHSGGALTEWNTHARITPRSPSHDRSAAVDDAAPDI